MRISDWSSDVCSSDLHPQTRTEFQVERLDQNHVPDGKARQHEDGPLSGRRMFPNKLISPLVPFAAGIIGTQYSRSFLSFFGNAQRVITFGQPHQRLWRMRRRLIFVDHLAEADRKSTRLTSSH